MKNDHNHNSSKENIKTAFLLNILFSILEFIGGLLTNSISILSDSIHDLGDALSIGVSYIFEKKSTNSPNEKYTYGYLRYSVMGALITSFVLLTGSILVIINSISRLFNPVEVNYDGMIIFAIFGVLINGYASYKTSHGEKSNEKAISLHMLEDVLGWVAVLIGSIFIKIFNTPIIDPILSLLIAIYILIHVYGYFKDIFSTFMEKVPDNINIDEIIKKMKVDTSIKNIHHIHIWTMDNVNNYLTAHIKLNKKLTEKEIIQLKQDINNVLIKSNIKHVTLEIEYKDETCKDPKDIK